jgi:hypothetical protein
MVLVMRVMQHLAAIQMVIMLIMQPTTAFLFPMPINSTPTVIAKVMFATTMMTTTALQIQAMRFR